MVSIKPLVASLEAKSWEFEPLADISVPDIGGGIVLKPQEIKIIDLVFKDFKYSGSVFTKTPLGEYVFNVGLKITSLSSNGALYQRVVYLGQGRLTKQPEAALWNNYATELLVNDIDPITSPSK